MTKAGHRGAGTQFDGRISCEGPEELNLAGAARGRAAPSNKVEGTTGSRSEVPASQWPHLAPLSDQTVYMFSR